MKNKNRFFIFLCLLGIMGLLLALSLTVLFGTPKTSLRSQEASIKNITGLNRLESKTSGSGLPLSSFKSYDQVHGTKLYHMASQLPSVSTSQLVTPSDFEQLQITAEKQLGEKSQKINWWWSFLSYLLVVAGLIIAPIWAKLLTNFTDECIYPLYKDAVLKRLNR